MASALPESVATSSPPRKCAWASCEEIALQRCSRCHATSYCGRDHQTKDWKRHQKQDCLPLPPPPPHASAATAASAAAFSSSTAKGYTPPMTLDTPDPSRSFVDLILDFCWGMLLGHERAIFRAARMPTAACAKPLDAPLSAAALRNMREVAIDRRLNEVYATLILRDHPCILQSFDAIFAVGCHHSPICLLHILREHCRTVAAMLPVDGFNNQHLALEAFALFMSNQLIHWMGFFRSSLEGQLAHDCKGPRDMSKEDPKRGFFTLPGVTFPAKRDVCTNPRCVAAAAAAAAARAQDQPGAAATTTTSS